MYNFRPTTLTVDTNLHNYFEDQGSSLDGNIIGSRQVDSGLSISPRLNSSRQESFEVSKAPLFSPKAEDWQHIEIQPIFSGSPFLEQNNDDNHTRTNTNNTNANTHNKAGNNHFLQLASQPTVFNQTSQWLLEDGSRMSNTMQIHELASACEVNAPIFQRQIQASFPSSTSQHITLLSPTTGHESTAASPQKIWPLSGARDPHRMPNRVGPQSPMFQSHFSSSRRSDGIRKKNARFDIPAERNLSNIDHLIAQSTDEQEIKELKQQKRLLRNRQAALDSRQRKKQHTERLEDEKKHFTSVISDLEDDLADAKLTIDDLLQKQAQYQQFLKNIQVEKEDLIRNHIIETSELRKKVALLTDHIQRLELTGVISCPLNSSGSLSDYTDVDNMAVDSGWDHISLIKEVEPEIKVKKPLASLKYINNLLANDSERPTAQGFLLLLLLFGAFVASKGPSSSIPKMSEDVRAASATLLEDIFHDASVIKANSDNSEASTLCNSNKSWFTPIVKPIKECEMPDSGLPSLSDLADALIQPTENQSDEQLFSLSAVLNDDHTDREFDQTPRKLTSQGRRNFCEVLAEMRNNDQKKPAAEAYARSLLMDQAPTEVVRKFARMVLEYSSKSP